MQSQRTAAQRESELAGVVPTATEAAAPQLTAEQEAQRRASMTSAISVERSILSGPPIPGGIIGLVAFNGQQQPPEDASVFAAGRLAILEIDISNDANVAAIQRNGLQRLRQEMANYPPDAAPVGIKEEGGKITLTNRCFLPFTNDERAELDGLMQAVMGLDYESMAAFQEVYLKLVYYARHFFVSSRGREVSFFGGYEEAGEIYDEIAQRCSEVRDLLFSSLHKIAEGRRAEVDVVSVNSAVDELSGAYYHGAYYRIEYVLSQAFTDGQEDASNLLARAQQAGVLSQIELGLLGQLVEQYGSLSIKISEIKDKIAAYMLGIPEFQPGTTERTVISGGGGEVYLPNEEERKLFMDFMDVCGALALFSARVEFEETFGPYMRYRDEAYRTHMPDAGTFDIDAWMSRRLDELPSDVANAMGRLQELGTFREKLQAYGQMVRNYSKSVLQSDDFVSHIDSRTLQERADTFSFTDRGIYQSDSTGLLLESAYSYLDDLNGAVAGVEALGASIPGIRKDRELFERFRTGDFWDKLYSYSEYFMRHGAADFLFWSTLAAGIIGAGATVASSLSSGAARVLATDLTELVAGREIQVLGVASAEAAAEAAAPSLIRSSLGFGYRMAADIDLLMGLPVFANALTYFAGNRSDDVYEDLNLMATFLLMRAGGAGGGFLPRLTSAAGTAAAGTRFVEDVRRGNVWQAIQDGTVTAVGGAMFVRTTAGLLSFADSASASGMFSTATGTRVLNFMEAAASRLAPVGTVLEWGAEAYTAPGFLGIYGFHMVNQCVRMWWSEVPLPSMAYEEGGFTALREYFSSTYTEGANFMPFMTIIFRVAGAALGAVRAAGRAAAEATAVEGLPSTLAPQSFSLVVPTTNPARTALAARLGAPEVAERLALDAGYLQLSPLGLPTEDALAAIRTIALSEQRLPAEEVLARLGVENTRAARRWVENTLNAELDKIWKGADLLASARPLPSLQSARGRELTQMLERAQNLRDLSIAGGAGGVYGIAAGFSALSVSAFLPEAGALREAQGRFVNLMTTQDMGTNAFMNNLAAGLYAGLGRKPFNLGIFSNFAVTMASLFNEIETGQGGTALGGEVDMSAYRDIYKEVFPNERDRMNAIFAVFLSLAAHGRLDPADAGNPSRFRDSITSFGDSLKQLKDSGFDFSGAGLSDLFFLADYLSNGGTVAKIKEVWLKMGGFYANTYRTLLPQASSEEARAETLQELEYYRQMQKLIIPVMCYGLEAGRDTEWAFAAVERITNAVRGTEQLQLWRPEMVYAMLGDSIFASEAAIDSIPEDDHFRLYVLLLWDNLFRFDPRFQGMWKVYYPGEAAPFE